MSIRALVLSDTHLGFDLPANPRVRRRRRGHDFLHLAARAMRMIVLDEARGRRAQKRGGDELPVTLDEALDGSLPVDPIAMIDFDAALTELQELDPRAAQVIECRVFGGLDAEETARSLDISTATVKRDFRAARAFLAQRLS